MAALCAAAGWALTPPARALDSPATAPTAAAIAKAVKELAHDQYRVRERATKFLWAAGRAAEPALREALKSKDLEVVSRAEFILEKFKWGLYPDTPKQVVDLIEQYRKADRNAKRALIEKISALKAHAYRTLSAVAEAETDQLLKADIRRRLRKHVKTAVTALLADGKFAEAEVMLETIAAAGHAEGIRHYVAFALQRGKLTDKIDYWTKTSQPAAAEVLTYLHRANGDLAAARRAAEKTRDDALLDPILFEQGDWKALARRQAAKPTKTPDGKTDIEALGFLAAYQRLTGDAKAFETTLKAVEDHAAAGKDDLWHCIEVFLVNDRPADALKLATRHGDHDTAAALLIAQWKFAEAIDLIRQARKELPDDNNKAFALDMTLARHLNLLGEKDQVAKICQKAFESQNSRRDSWRINQAVSMEMAAGLTDQAVRHWAEAAAWMDENVRRTLLGAVLPAGYHGRLGTWWDFFRSKHPGETFAATLGRVRRLLDRKTGAAGFPALAKEVEKSLAAAEAKEVTGWYETLAATAKLLGHKDLLLGYRRKAAESPAAPRAAWEYLGDELLRQQQWADAAKAYERAAKDAGSSLAAVTYLRGWALARAGQTDEGAKAMDLAALLPLGDEAARFGLAVAMADRGEDAAAAAQYRLIAATGGFDSWHLSNATRRLADRRAKARPKADECFQIADVYERYRLDCLRPSIGLPGAGGYLTWVLKVHQVRARGHLAAGRFDDAQREIDRCLALKPGNVDLVIRLVPELQRAGRKAQADVAFAKVFDLHEKTIRDYPRTILHRNNAAWLAALCRRRLDAALKHATEAVKLKPDYAPNMDTLAEVHFQRGQTAEAVKLMKRCIELDPDRAYYRKQLKRFQAGDRASMPPEY